MKKYLDTFLSIVFLVMIFYLNIIIILKTNQVNAADTKVSALTVLNSLADEDFLYIVDISAGTSRRLIWSSAKVSLKGYFDTIYTTAYVNDSTNGLLNSTYYSLWNSTQILSTTYATTNANGIVDSTHFLQWDTGFIYGTTYNASKNNYDSAWVLSTTMYADFASSTNVYSTFTDIYNSIATKADTSLVTDSTNGLMTSTYIQKYDSANYWGTTYADSKSYYDSAWDSDTIQGLLNNKENILIWSLPLSETGNTVSVDLTGYSTTGHNHDDLYPKFYYDSVAPTIAPIKIGDFFRDTTLQKIYFGFDTTDSTNWILLN